MALLMCRGSGQLHNAGKPDLGRPRRDAPQHEVLPQCLSKVSRAASVAARPLAAGCQTCPL